MISTSLCVVRVKMGHAPCGKEKENMNVSVSFGYKSYQCLSCVLMIIPWFFVDCKSQRSQSFSCTMSPRCLSMRRFDDIASSWMGKLRQVLLRATQHDGTERRDKTQGSWRQELMPHLYGSFFFTGAIYFWRRRKSQVQIHEVSSVTISTSVH